MLIQQNENLWLREQNYWEVQGVLKPGNIFYSFASNEQYIDIDLWLTHSYNYSGLTEEIEGEPIRQK